MLLAAALAYDGVVAWVIWRMIRQSRRYRSLAFPDPEPGFDWPSVAVVIPARNEADAIARCVSGLLDQNYPGDRITVWLVDDASTDGTAQVATAAARGEPRFRLQRGAALPQGWTGKSHACWQGARAVNRTDYICFVDADTSAAPGLLRAAVFHAVARGVDMISLEPFQELGTPIERLVIPCGLYLIAASQDLAKINSPRDPVAAANGQFLLFRRPVYDRIGGHAAVRAEICEDAALAGLCKRAGFRFELLGAERFIRTRMYRDARSLWTGLSKNASVLGGGPIRTVLLAGAGLAIVATGLALAVPVFGSVFTERERFDLPGASALLCGLGAIFGLHLAGTRHFRFPLVYGLLFPFGYGLAFAVAIESARLAYTGSVRWKDRTYAARSPGAGVQARNRLLRSQTDADTGV